MAKASLPPFIVWRDGRPRFVPGARERDLGFKGEDLRHDGPQGAKSGSKTGAWFAFEEADSWGRARHAAILEARTRGTKAQRPLPLAPRGATLGALLDDWLDSDAVQSLSARTIEGYRKQVAAVTWKPGTAVARRTEGNTTDREPLSLTPMSALDWPELLAFVNAQRKARGHHMALAMLAVISAAWTWGCGSTKWRLPPNPRIGKRLARPEGRIVIYDDVEIRALIAAADTSGRASIGDAILLGLFTGQRQTDRLALADDGLHDGRRVLRQSKTGTVVAIKETPRLAERLGQARARVAALTLKLGLQQRPREIVVDESTGRPYNEHTYRHVFEAVRARAIAAGCASLAFLNAKGERDHKTDQDLRDTCVTLLYRAGNDPLAICDITGHSYKSVQTIVSHYLARNAERADTAIDKLVAYMDAKGMAV